MLDEKDLTLDRLTLSTMSGRLTVEERKKLLKDLVVYKLKLSVRRAIISNCIALCKEIIALEETGTTPTE